MALARVAYPSTQDLTDWTIVHLAVFLVEDNAEVQEHLAGALEELTCVKVVGAAATEADAIAWVAGHEGWDLLIVDLFLRGGSGMRLVQRIQRPRPDQKIIVFSNYVNAGVRKRCAQLAVDAVFDKSTEIDALVDYCAHLCALLGAPPAPPAQRLAGSP